MPFARHAIAGMISATLVSVTASTAMAAPPSASEKYVTPIAWQRFHAPAHPDEAYRACESILQKNVRYNLNWMEREFPWDAQKRQYLVPGESKQDGVRAPASAAYAVALLLKTGAYNEKLIGIPKKEAIRRTVALIRGTAASHLTTSGDGKRWGDHWQSALWAGLLGQAGWMLWDDMDTDTRRLLANVIVHEADRFIAPDYKVPYWANPDGHINFPGDTKAEENAWESMVLQVAVAMMPRHPHVAAWKNVCSELMVSSFAQQTDLKNATMRDGKPVKTWLRGFNVREDGAVVNHNIVHPDYMATPIQNLRAYLVFSLAGKPVPQTASFNADLIYRTLASHAWTAPPYQAPGGTMYQPGKAELYYPQKTDWSRYRFDIYYVFDTYANQFGWDKSMPSTAKEWMRVRIARIKAMQDRHPDGSVYAPGEFDNYIGREQLVSWQLGDAFLLQWLAAQNRLQKTGNWLP
jgi:hypothetical protein